MAQFIEGSEELLAEGVIYKACTNSELVVSRKLKLYRSKFTTFHDFEKDPDNKKSWYLDRKCELSPKTVDALVTSKKLVRPHGTWTITATVTGVGSSVNLVRLVGSHLETAINRTQVSAH